MKVKFLYMRNRKGYYKKPRIVIKKLKIDLFFSPLEYEDEGNFLAGACPGACGPGNCGGAAETAFCCGLYCCC